MFIEKQERDRLYVKQYSAFIQLIETVRQYDPTNKLRVILCPECKRPTVTCKCMKDHFLHGKDIDECTDDRCRIKVMQAVINNIRIDVCDCWLIECTFPQSPGKPYKSRCLDPECNSMFNGSVVDTTKFKCYPKDGPYGFRCMTKGHTLRNDKRLGKYADADRARYFKPGIPWQDKNGDHMHWDDINRVWTVFQTDIFQDGTNEVDWVISNWKHLEYAEYKYHNKRRFCHG